MKQILLETEFSVGDIVTPKICDYTEDKTFFSVLHFYILGIDENGFVKNYNVDCSDQYGNVKSFKPFEITIFEKVIKEK